MPCSQSLTLEEVGTPYSFAVPGCGGRRCRYPQPPTPAIRSPPLAPSPAGLDSWVWRMRVSPVSPPALRPPLTTAALLAPPYRRCPSAAPGCGGWMLSLPFAPPPSHPPPPPLKPPSLSPSPSARPPAVPGCGGCRVDPEPRRRGTVVGRPPPWLWGWGGPGQHVVKGGGGPAGSKPQGSRGLVVGGEGGPTQPGLAWRQPVPAPAGNTCRRMPQAARTECDREHGGETAGGRESVRQRCHLFLSSSLKPCMYHPRVPRDLTRPSVSASACCQLG